MSCAVSVCDEWRRPARRSEIKQSKRFAKNQTISKSHEYHEPIKLVFSNQNNQNPGKIPGKGKHCRWRCAGPGGSARESATRGPLRGARYATRAGVLYTAREADTCGPIQLMKPSESPSSQLRYSAHTARRTLKGTARAASYHSRSPPSASTSPPSPTRGQGRRLSPPPGDASAMLSPAGISCPPPLPWPRVLRLLALGVVSGLVGVGVGIGAGVGVGLVVIRLAKHDHHVVVLLL